MSFYGKYFSFDGISSETYGLKIAELDANGVNKSMGTTALEIKEQRVWRNIRPHFYGATYNSKLKFPMSVFSADEIDQDRFERIQAWLFSPRTYRVLTIDQNDMQDTYFECLLNQSQGIRVGNKIMGLSWEVICSTPFALKFPKTTTYTFSSPPSSVVKTYLNLSGETDAYLVPTSLVITMNGSGGDVSITNLDDANRVVSFIGLSASEVLTINPSLQTISSSTGLRRLANSNKRFLRLVHGQNRLQITGNVSSIAMTNQWISKKLGG